MTALTARLAPFALLGILALTACGGGAAPAATDPDPESAEPGIATSCPDGVIEAFAEYRYPEFEVTPLDSRDSLDAIGLTSMSPAPSCFGEIAFEGGTYSIGFWIGAEPAFLDYVVNQMTLAGYEQVIDEDVVVSFAGTAPEHPSGDVLSNSVSDAELPGVSDLVTEPFVTIEWETLS